jgi:HlyD family secretion protein
MDIPRESSKRNRLIRRTVIAAAALAAGVVVTLGLSRLRPAAPTVERATIWTDMVEQGPMVREVRGTGRLVPERIRWITAPVQGRIEKILVLPGTPVAPNSILLELINPDLEKSASDAQWQLKSAEAELECKKARLQNDALDMEASLARLKAQYEEAKLQVEVDSKLFKDDLLSERKWRLCKARAEQLAKLIAIEEKRTEVRLASHPAELATTEAQLAQAKAKYERQRRQLESLSVRAGVEGVLQKWEDEVEVGRQVSPGMALAKISDPKQLKAEVKIPEVQARDVLAGQQARIDMGGVEIAGRVMRVDPAAEEGTVAVDLSLDGELPKGARPDLTVVGTIEIERLDDVLFVNRPVNAHPDSVGSLFKIDPETGEAVRAAAKFGSSSVSTIQVLEGLNAGDEVILSDMSQWDDTDRIRLK